MRLTGSGRGVPPQPVRKDVFLQIPCGRAEHGRRTRLIRRRRVIPAPPLRHSREGRNPARRPAFQPGRARRGAVWTPAFAGVTK